MLTRSPDADPASDRFSNGDVTRAFLHRKGAHFAIGKMSHLAALSEGERRFLENAAETFTTLPPRAALHGRDDPASGPTLLLSGCLRESHTDVEGRSQTLSIHWPGDLVGLGDLWTDRHSWDVDALTPSRVARLPVFGQWPDGTRLREIAERFVHVERSMVLDRLRLLGHGRAEERIVHFLLECNARQSLVLPELGDRAWLPFSQTELGNVLGLTNVYISKTMSRLRERGVIEVEGDMVAFPNRAAAERDVEFVDHLRAARPVLG